MVNDPVDILIKTEQRQSARKADDMAAFRNGVSLIIDDLLIAMEVKEVGWSYQLSHQPPLVLIEQFISN